MIALVDGDILVYRTGFAANEEGMERIARARMNETITTMLATLNAQDFRIFLSDSKSNFRLKLFPLYKANRKQPKPIHYEYLINVLLKDWNAEVCFDEEADDGLGITQGSGTVICSIDKDLYQIPGRHYNWVTGNTRYIKESEGLYNFYKQVLTGDATDNVCTATGLGCPGIGEKKAEAALEGCQTEEEYFQTVCRLYRQQLKDLSACSLESKLLLTGQLLKIRQKEEEIWNFPFKPDFATDSPQ